MKNNKINLILSARGNGKEYALKQIEIKYKAQAWDIVSNKNVSLIILIKSKSVEEYNEIIKDSIVIRKKLIDEEFDLLKMLLMLGGEQND